MSVTSSNMSDASDVDSFASVEENIAALNHLLTEIYGEAEELETHLMTLSRPLENTQLGQLGALPFLEASPFRRATFKIKPPGFPGADLARRYPFHTICTLLRKYLLNNNCVLPDGNIKLNTQLQELFEIKEETIGYVSLLGRLRHILE